MYTVKDGIRSLQFDGKEIASSTSRSSYKNRWIEFNLYRTASGRFVLSRVGMSRYFHQKGCSIVKRNNIHSVPAENLAESLIECGDCRPSRVSDLDLYPESPRFWAQTIESAEGVVSSLKKVDEHGTEYLTDVAKRLLEEAASVDQEIYDAFYTEWVD